MAELGASTVQGASVANSVYNLAVMEGLLEPPLVKRGRQGMIYTSHGGNINSVVAMNAYAVFRQIESMAMSIFTSGIAIEDQNLKGFMEYHIKREAKFFSDMQKEDALMAMNAYLATIKERVGVGLESVNIRLFGSMPTTQHGNVKIPVGFVGVLAPLIRDIPYHCIKYCSPVSAIKWGACEADNKRATVMCGEESFQADYVVVTTPLGFLKNKADCFFTPKLPSEKTDAISKAGFGHINNLFLQFSKPLFKDQDNLIFTWRPEDNLNCGCWTRGLTSFVSDESSEKVIKAVVTGQEAIDMETIDADQIMNDVQKLLQTFLGNPCIPKPTSILRSRWSTNVYTQGALTYMGLESSLDHIKQLADPIGDSRSAIPILLFAGEHTNPTSYGTAHGARDSGVREANRIISYTKELKGKPSAIEE